MIKRAVILLVLIGAAVSGGMAFYVSEETNQFPVREFVQRAAPSGNTAQLFKLVMSEAKHTGNNGDKLLAKSHTARIEQSFGKSGQTRFYYADRPLPFLALIAAKSVHGRRDIDKTYPEMMEVLGQRHLSVLCGHITELSWQMLTMAGFEARHASGSTVGPRNGYDDGHALLEVNSPVHGWVLVDVDMKTVFRRNGKLLSALDVALTDDLSELEIVKLIDAPVKDYAQDAQFDPIEEFAVYNKKDWYKRVLQIVSVHDQKTGQSFWLETERFRSSKIDVPSLGEEAFRGRFY